MAKADTLTYSGTITDALPGGKFKVTLENKHNLDCVISGKIRKFNIRLLVGDRVDVEMSPYDLSLGRISFRHK